MMFLRLLGVIALHTAVLAGCAEVVWRSRLKRDAHASRRLWIATSLLVPLLAVVLSLGLSPRLSPLTVIATTTRATTAAAGRTIAFAPLHYRHVDSRVPVITRVIYSAVAGSILLILTAGWFRVRGLARRAKLLGDVLISQEIAGPVTAGIWKPTIILPLASQGWDRDLLRAAFAHERAHVLRRDTLWLALAWLSSALLWFTPAAWLSLRRLRRTMEEASDFDAAKEIGGALTYATLLTQIASEALQHRGRLLTAAMTGGASLEMRIETLLAAQSQHHSSRRPYFVFAAAFAFCLLDWRAITRPPLRADPHAQVLLQQLDGNGEQRADALYALARWREREPDVIPILAAHLGDDTPIAQPRRWNFDVEGWAPAYAQWKHASVGEVAALGLASIGAPAAETLVEVLGNGNAAARRNAAWAMGEMRHPRELSRRASNVLIATLNDPDADVRAAAAWALGDIGERRAVGALRERLLSERAPRARAEAANSLAALERGRNLESLRHEF
jgi:hypothetical protein